MTGAIGKKVVLLSTVIILDNCLYSWSQKVGEAYKMEVKALSPNWGLAVQNQMIDQAINERPDMILLIPLDAKTAPQQARKINQAGIP